MASPFLTNATNFDHAVTVLVVKQLTEALRAGLPWAPTGSVIPATLVPGTNGTIRYLSIADLPTAVVADLVEGTPPTGQSINLDYFEIATTQKGGFVEASDLTMDEFPSNLAAVMAEKVARQVKVQVDGICKAAYAAKAAEITSATTITLADIQNAVTIMRARNVMPLTGGGYYTGVAGPALLGDIQKLTGFVSAAQFANPQALLTGSVGAIAGVQFVDAGSNDISYFGTATANIVTGVASTDVVTAVAHGFTVNQAFQFGSLTGGAGAAASTTYYVKTVPTADTFTFSATKGGAKLDFTTDMTAGTLKSEIKRCQIIGARSLAAGDLGSVKILTAQGPTTVDPLAQLFTVGWKARLGAALVAVDETDSAGTDVPRTVGIDADSAFFA